LKTRPNLFDYVKTIISIKENMQLSYIEIIILAIVLGIDAFTVALAVGAGSCTLAQVFRMSASFGFFQFIMPVIGWYGGTVLIELLNGQQRLISFLLLTAVGIHMIIESGKEEDEKISCDRTKGWTLLGLSVATSIDALGVGITLGALGAQFWFPAIVIGTTAALMTWAGMHFGKRISDATGYSMELAGGIVLILLGIRMLFF
jgi:manganese efflux pump family protein